MNENLAEKLSVAVDSGSRSGVVDDVATTSEDYKICRERDIDEEEGYDLEMRLALLRNGLESDVLPSVKEGEPNMHYCWLSTTNQTDPIHRRLRLGYVLVKADELPEFKGDYRVSSGQFEGCICVNEMVLSKIHKRLYDEIMIISHHERPMQEEELIKQNASKSETDREGTKLGGFDKEDQGFRNIVNRRQTPKSFD